ncbi:hypothetical protein C7M61_003511 [Candidozyma pseudohaemuli]|uniref:Uncharacterized protein n=1 Tax=Candidozyma pseudohaemuli TaxID=418784 RepID=A0A2P7YM92_9ASCO|nr:hypothetical protein C7M61_003511 [[Candida] pseudohaemulonii]PSK37084.1 hypothetical protein C7M61_003511 [[Candida] pseudohaemulonii]
MITTISIPAKLTETSATLPVADGTLNVTFTSEELQDFFSHYAKSTSSPEASELFQAKINKALELRSLAGNVPSNHSEEEASDAAGSSEETTLYESLDNVKVSSDEEVDSEIDIGQGRCDVAQNDADAAFMDLCGFHADLVVTKALTIKSSNYRVSSVSEALIEDTAPLSSSSPKKNYFDVQSSVFSSKDLVNAELLSRFSKKAEKKLQVGALSPYHHFMKLFKLFEIYRACHQYLPEVAQAVRLCYSPVFPVSVVELTDVGLRFVPPSFPKPKPLFTFKQMVVREKIALVRWIRTNIKVPEMQPILVPNNQLVKALPYHDLPKLPQLLDYYHSYWKHLPQVSRAVEDFHASGSQTVCELKDTKLVCQAPALPESNIELSGCSATTSSRSIQSFLRSRSRKRGLSLRCSKQRRHRRCHKS